MAEARVPSLGGFDEEFVNAVEDELQCAICQLPLKDPILTKCGHRFCKQCLDEHFRRLEIDRQQSCCPVDRNNLIRVKDIFPDKATERKILSLIIKCPNKDCDWTGELRSKEDHLASCPFKDVSCTNKNCELKLARKYLTEHVTTKCQWRIMECGYCGEHHPQCQMENHLETCKGFLIACPNNCGIRISSEKIPHHVENSCPLTKVPCPYTWIGCNSEIRREELESHLQCETRHHLELACCKLNNIQEDVRGKTRKPNSLEEKVASIQRQHQEKVNNLQDQFEERVKLLENQFEERVKLLENQFEERVKFLEDGLEEKVKLLEDKLEEKVHIQTRVNKKVNENYKKVEKQLNTGRKVFCIAKKHIEKKVDDFQKKTGSLNTELGYEIMLLNAAEPYTFTWKIKSFENILTQAKNGRQVEIESEPFYMYGYKLKLQLRPNASYGDGENTHVSLFVTLLKGENDAILAWPFQKKLKFTLIDQQENPADRENVTFEFTADPTHVESFAKPITNENTGRGCQKFVSHEELRTRRFVVDDVIFIQIQVGPP